jgi:hypothetical protein
MTRCMGADPVGVFFFYVGITYATIIAYATCRANGSRMQRALAPDFDMIASLHAALRLQGQQFRQSVWGEKTPDKRLIGRVESRKRIGDSLGILALDGGWAVSRRGAARAPGTARVPEA